MYLREFYLILVVFVLPATCNEEEDKGSMNPVRNATTLQFPYEASIEFKCLHFCGGSIIAKHFILTSAHCVFNKTDEVNKKYFRVRVGSDVTGSEGQLYSVSGIVIHENYDVTSEHDEYDIAILYLDSALQYTDRIKAVELAHNIPRCGTRAWASGYGIQEGSRRNTPNSRKHLMAVELPIISRRKCQKILKGIMEDMICAGFKREHSDNCVGGSGSPLVAKNKQVGIVAWGVGCGRPGYPSVYTNVAMYIDWISKAMAKFDHPWERAPKLDTNYN